MLMVTQPKNPLKEEAVSSRLVGSLVHSDRSSLISIVRFSADGKNLFVAGYPSGVLEFWDVARRDEIKHVAAQPGYRGTSDYVDLTADWRKAYLAWDRLRETYADKEEEAGRRLEHEGGVLVYDIVTGQSLQPFRRGPRRGAIYAFVSPDGARLVALERVRGQSRKRDEDEMVLWDTRQRRAKVLAAGFGFAAFSPDSRLLALCVTDEKNDSTLQLFDVDGRWLAKLSSLKGHEMYRPRFSADGKLLCVEEGKGRVDRPATLRIWDLASRREIATIPSDGAFPFGEFRFSADGKRLAASDYRGAVWLWDVPAGKLIWKRLLPAEISIRHLVFSPDASRLAIYGQPKWKSEDSEPDPRDIPQPRLFLFDLAASSLEPEVVMCPHGYVGGLDFSPDGKLLAAGGCGVTWLFDMAPPRLPKR